MSQNFPNFMKTVNPQIPNLNETPQKQCGENQTNTSDNQMAGNFIEKKKSLQVFKNQISVTTMLHWH